MLPLSARACSYCQHKIRSAKRAARSELSVTRGEWAKHGYAASDILSTDGIQDTVPRVHASVSTASAAGSVCRPPCWRVTPRGVLT